MNTAEEKLWSILRRELYNEKKSLADKKSPAVKVGQLYNRPVSVERFSQTLDIMRSWFLLGQAAEDGKYVQGGPKK